MVYDIGDIVILSAEVLASLSTYLPNANTGSENCTILKDVQPVRAPR